MGEVGIEKFRGRQTAAGWGQEKHIGLREAVEWIVR